jgi:hypothetical protein
MHRLVHRDQLWGHPRDVLDAVAVCLSRYTQTLVVLLVFRGNGIGGSGNLRYL